MDILAAHAQRMPDAPALIEAEEIGALTLKGLARPVPAVNVVGLKPRA